MRAPRPVASLIAACAAGAGLPKSSVTVCPAAGPVGTDPAGQCHIQFTVTAP
jgi:hypothetical protein